MFDEAYFEDHPWDSLPDLFFKGFRKDELIQSTEDTVLWNEKAGGTDNASCTDIILTFATLF
jgi:hypothetical protein